MIDRKIFDKEMKRICILIGQNPSKELVNQFYEEFKHYELPDFLQACKDREMLKEMLRLKINLITLEDFILKKRGLRMDRESIEKEKRLNKEAEIFFKRQDIPEEAKEFMRKLKGA